MNWSDQSLKSPRSRAVKEKAPEVKEKKQKPIQKPIETAVKKCSKERLFTISFTIDMKK